MELCISVTWSVYNFMIYTFFLPLWTAVSRSIRNIHCGICHTVNLCSLFIHLAIFYFCSWFEYLFSWRKSKARASGDWQKLNDLCSVSRHWPVLYLSLSLCFLLPGPGPDPSSPTLLAFSIGFERSLSNRSAGQWYPLHTGPDPASPSLLAFSIGFERSLSNRSAGQWHPLHIGTSHMTFCLTPVIQISVHFLSSSTTF